MKHRASSALRLLISLCFCTCAVVNAQPLHIHYDVRTKAAVYVAGGDTLERPVVRHGYDVLLHLNNLNTYRYAAEVTRKTARSESDGGGANFLKSLAPGLTGGLPGGFTLPGLGGQLGNTPYSEDPTVDDDWGDDGWGDEEDARGFVGEDFSGATQLRTRFETLMYEMSVTEAAVEEAHRLVTEQFTQRKYVDLAAREIRYLKYGSDLAPAQIRQLATGYHRRALGDQIQTADILTVADEAAASLQAGALAMDRTLAAYRRQLNELAEIDGLLAAASSSTATTSLGQEIIAMQTVALAFYDRANQQRQLVEPVLDGGEARFTRRLLDLHYEMESLKASPFAHTERFTAGDGPFSLHPVLYAVDTAGNRSGGSSALPPIRVGVRGGLVVSTSVGLSVGQFFERPQSYLVREGVIVADEEDAFLPIVNTLLHFHSYGDRGLRVGGTIGVGLPLSGSDASRTATFLLGPTFILGDRDKVFLSLGLLGGRVGRLPEGLRAGDAFTFPNGLLPELKERYELGYFLGVSYRLFGGNG